MALSDNAERALQDQLSRAECDALLAPLVALADAKDWSDALDGAAVFVARDVHEHYRLPVEVPELLVVSDSFHIRPLLRYVQSNRQYYVLLLAQGHVGFLKGSAEGLVSARVEGLPHSLDEALGEEDRERSVTYHFGARAGKNPIYGGQGKTDTSRDEDLARFCRAVDAAIWNVLRDETAPLFVAASPRLAALFQSITRYPHVVSGALGADLGRATVPEIHARTWPAVAQWMTTKEDVVLERYDRLVSKARALDDARAIAKFALEGRVRDLSLDRDAHLWGRLNRDTGDVVLHGDRPGDRTEDVLDDLAEAVLLRGGDVWSLDKSRMPTKSPVAATLRW